MKLSIFTLVFLSMGTYSFANDILKGPTPEQRLEMETHNKSIQENATRAEKREFGVTEINLEPSRPFAEYEENGYVIFSGETLRNTLTIKQAIAKNLPQDVTLVVYVKDSSEKGEAMRNFSSLISKQRLRIVELEEVYGGTFWARDAIPVPTITNSNSLRVVNAVYYHRFEPDEQFARLFNADLVSHEYYFEGGNLMVNRIGDCVVVNTTATQSIPDPIFERFYGCQRLHRLPYVKGIGHIDESVKFIDDKTVLTDTIEYRDILLAKGFKVRMLPRPSGKYETYVNALMINGTVFLPVFNHVNDQEAIDTYKSFGLKVVPLNSNELSMGQGSIHCITMNYPKVDMATLQRALNAKLK